MADRILRRTSYGGEQTDNSREIDQAVCRSPAAHSEPKLYRKNTVFTRNRNRRQTVKANQQFEQQNVVLSDSGGISSVIHTSGGSSDGVGGGAAGGDVHKMSRLQRQKVGSRKTFKFRKTRKDVSDVALGL